MQNIFASIPLSQLRILAQALVYAAGSFLIFKFLLRYLKRFSPIQRHLRLSNLTILLFTLYMFLWGIGVKAEIVINPLLALILVFAGFLLISLAEYFVFEILLTPENKLSTPGLLRDVLRILILFLIVYAVIFGVFHFNLSTVLVSSAVLTAVLGLALQDILSSILAGVVLNIEKPFNIGDWVQIAGKQGEVAGISWRATRIRTLENNFVIIPNNSISRAEIINFKQPSSVVGQFLYIGTSYNDPPNKVKRAVEDVAFQVPGILKNPAPRLRTKEYSDFYIKYDCKYYIRDFRHHQEIADDFTTRLWYKFKREGIEIPFPIRTVRSMEAAEKRATSQTESAHRRIKGYLRSLPFFASLSDDEIERLTKNTPLYYFGVSEDIIIQGDEGSSMFIIISGKVKIIVKDKIGETVITELGEGEAFGEMSLLTGEKRSATVRCIEDSEIVEITKASFKDILSNNPSLAEQLSEKISVRAQEIKEKIRETNKLQQIQTKGQIEKSKILGIIRKFFEL